MSTEQEAIERKRLVRELEKQFAAEDQQEKGERLAKAREKAGNNEGLQSLLQWFEVLQPLGGHATYILQAWTGWQYRLSHAPIADP